MPWKKSDSLISNQLLRHGLGPTVIAFTLCQEAERLYPGLLKATSFVDGTLRVSVLRENQMAFRIIEGKLLAEMKVFATEKKLPVPARIRLTITRESDRV